MVTAQTAYLTAERAAERVRARCLQVSVALAGALGDGWKVGTRQKPLAVR